MLVKEEVQLFFLMKHPVIASVAFLSESEITMGGRFGFRVGVLDYFSFLESSDGLKLEEEPPIDLRHGRVVLPAKTSVCNFD